VLDRFLDALTGRRLGGALLLLAGVIVLLIVLWPSGDDGGGRRPAARGTQPARLVSVPQLGLAYAYPSTWSRTVSGRVIRLSSPGDAVVMTFASPVEGHHTERVRSDAESALRKQFAPASVVHEGPGKLGSRPVTTFELEGQGPRDEVRVLALVGSTPYRTYVVTLITPPRPSAKRLAEAQEILRTVRLTKPVGLASKS
jgi:hypothetical protein